MAADKTEVHELYLKEARPIIIGKDTEGVRFTFQRSVSKTGKNENALALNVKTVIQRLTVTGEVDIPLADVLLFVRGYLEREEMKKTRGKR